jgi:cytidylate kinase
MSRKHNIVAIDGPAGAGKSTVARTLAKALGFVMLDTGALYRSVALAANQAEVSWDDDEAMTALAHQLASDEALRFEPDPASERGIRVLLAGHDVSQAIRTSEISMGASKVSAIGGVRDALMELQRQLGAHPPGVVAEGRDIGTVVFPRAPAKFFLTASPEIRARRRLVELEAGGDEVDFETVLAEVKQRDKQDSEREVAPLKKADDAILVDSSDRSVEQVVAEMKRLVDDAIA